MKISDLIKKVWLLGLVTPFFALAQRTDMGLSVVNQYDPQARSLPDTIMVIINYALTIVGVIALAYIVYGGFLYITAHGDSNQVDTAKNIIVYAVIGIVVIGVAAAIVNFVVGAVV